MADAMTLSLASRFPLLDDLPADYQMVDFERLAIEQFITAQLHVGAAQHRTIGQLVDGFHAILLAQLVPTEATRG